MARGRGRETGLAEQFRNVRFLTDAEFDHQMAVGLEQLGSLSRNGAIAGEAVGAAIERTAGIVADLGRKPGDVAAGDVGGVADHKVEPAGQRRAEIAGRECRAAAKPETTGVVARGP